MTTNTRIGFLQAQRTLRQHGTGFRVLRVPNAPNLAGIDRDFAVVPLRRGLRDVDVTVLHVVAWGDTLREAVDAVTEGTN